jgi:hypothetical protein
MRFRANAVCAVLFLSCILRAAEPVAAPLPDHPGNVFLAGEEIAIALPAGNAAAWQLIDYDGKLVRQGQAANDRAAIGQLPVGYYELRRTGDTARTTVGVLAPLKARTPRTSPIGVDVAMSWFYPAEKRPAVANLCVLAGINWVRDRMTWPELEPKKGEFANNTRYDDSARVQSAAGLRILQVHHSSPAWSTKNTNRFPPDLRDIYSFQREIARRWKGQVEAFEPWNEAEIDVFGGHTGAEMAALQKAAYWGLKAGNPDAIACLNVFAHERQATLEDFAANEAWPYFDTCNLHHYVPVERYPRWYAAFRGISGGRPLWVSEFAMPVEWADEATKEPSDPALRTQAERLPISFAASLHEAPAATFYFILPNYVEGKTQFGIIHADLTPRPAYLALAAVGRFLADAHPLGRLKSDRDDVHAYLFRARPDGQETEVLLAWSGDKPAELNLQVAPTATFDHLGRMMEEHAARLKLSRRPIYALLPPDSAKRLPLDPPPAMPPRREAKPSPIVLQAYLPPDQISVDHSAYRIPADGPQTISIFVYNFGDQPATGKLSLSAPKALKVSLPDKVDIAPGERKEIPLMFSGADIAPTVQTISVNGDFGPAGRAVISTRIEKVKAR